MIPEKKASILEKLGYYRDKNNNNIFKKGVNTIYWIETINGPSFWNIEGNFINYFGCGINSYKFDEVLEILSLIDNPRTTILNILLESYLILDHFFNTLEPILL